MTVVRNDDAWDAAMWHLRTARSFAMTSDSEPSICTILIMGWVCFALRLLCLFYRRTAGPGDGLSGFAGAEQLAGFEVFERFYEIGSPAGLAETRQYLSNKGTDYALHTATSAEAAQ